MADSEALLTERVRSLAEPVLGRHDAELVELAVKRGPIYLVRLTVDREDGIDLETCAKVSEELSRLMDADDPIPGRYTLEVTSPGADRPLRTARDFRRNEGRTVRVVMASGNQVEGPIESIEEERVKVGGDWVALTDVAKAKIVLPW
ncbi:MAG TPA: ribosome maturation factor RimP [Actinomycetota bacterium]|nr:ribosome maturation factor RimP [Actinomycetota bacterium]